jgi:xanthine dehydrogenase accessory factor
MVRTEVFAAALAALAEGRGVAIASVIGAKGSTPRHLGARMAVASDGVQWGTIGGGKIEQVVVDAAREVARGAAHQVIHHHLVRDLAMCCGGQMTIAVTPAAPSRGVLAAIVEGFTGVMATPLDGAPLSIRAARAGDPSPHRPRVEAGELVERIGRGERAILFGAGHVTQALGPLLAQLEFDVVICDDGDTGALAAGSPSWAVRVIESFDAAEVERELGGFTADDRVLIVTRDHAIDQQLVERLILRPELGYLGMIGSRGKVGRFHKRLAAKGLLDGDAGATRWARLRAPIGLDLGAETPHEIAVAIAAELIAVRRRGAPAAGDWTGRGEELAP